MFKIDIRSRVPVYEQLEKLIVKYVSLGALSPDEQLPSVRAMAGELGINPNTVQKAYKILEEHKVIYTLPGRGAFVSAGEKSLDTVKCLAMEKFEENVLQAKDTGLYEDELVKIVKKVFSGGNK